MVLAALSPLCLQARGIADVLEKLKSVGTFDTEATFTVTLPSREDDVTYRLRVAQTPTPADTLAPCSYLIRWELDTPSGPAQGWTSYFQGNLYSYRDHRLREYHTSWDPAPFGVTGRNEAASSTGNGVQRTAQFTSLLPSFLAEELSAMVADTLYTVSDPKETTCDGIPALKVDAIMTVGGETVQEKNYWFDSKTGAPLRIDTESNPASITEQTITVRYTPVDPAKAPEAGTTVVPATEEALIALYPEHFEKYRESNFSIENLQGTPLPTFALPTATGERYTHHKGDHFAAPTVVALIDPSTSFTPRIVSDIRSAVESSAVPADVLWAVAGNNADAAEGAVPDLRPGEHLLLNSRSLARDCGAASLPVILVADTAGKVQKVILGYNPDLTSLVIQSIALLQ
jgi:hypothetical protein